MPSVIITEGCRILTMNSGRIFIGTIFVLLGLIIFLNNMGVLPWDLWVRLIQLWPVLLIAIGLRIAFPRGILAILSGLVLVLAVIFALAFPHYFYMVDTEHVHGVSSEILDEGVTEALFTANIGASNVRISSIDTGSFELRDKLYSTEYSVVSDNLPVMRYSVSGNKAHVRFESEERTGSFRVRWSFGRSINFVENMKIWLNPKVVWELDLDIGASKLEADFSELPVSRLDIDSGASDIDIKLGNNLKHSTVSIAAGASDVRIVVPRDLGVKVNFKSALTSTNLRELGFVERDGAYLSPGYNYADNTVEIDFSSGVSKFVLELDS